MGIVANMAIVYAKLYVRDEPVGVFPFVTWIRDEKTHEVLPGVELGDIGPKLGYAGKDNGFMSFTNFRIPKENLLSKFFELDN